MKKSYEYRSSDDALKEKYSTRSLSVEVDDEEDVVCLQAKVPACFKKWEAVDFMRELINILDR